MAQRGGPRIATFGDDFSYSRIATRRMFGGAADVRAMDSLEACPVEVPAHRADIAVVPAHNTENGGIAGMGGVPLAYMAEPMGLCVLAALELPVGHVLAPFGRLEDIITVRSSGVALAQRSRIIEARVEAALRNPGQPRTAQLVGRREVRRGQAGSLHRGDLQRGRRRPLWRAHSEKEHRKLAGQRHGISRVCHGRLGHSRAGIPRAVAAAGRGGADGPGAGGEL